MIVRWIASMLFLLMISGCSDSDSGLWIEGKVVFRGEPIPQGTIMFYPTDGRPSSAIIEEEGSYEVQLPPGEYRVTVTASVAFPEGWKRGDPLPEPSLELPASYSSRRKTPLSATIAEDQTEPVDFTLD